MIFLLFSFLFLILFPNSGTASTLDGRGSIIYQSTTYTFTSNCYALGIVILNDGFTLASGHVHIGLNVPLYGTMDLNRTGSMVLENDLVLASNFTLADGGIIQGNGNSITLNNDLIIPEMTTLRIADALSIEGNGHTILIDNFAQILADTNATLTLRNLILKNVNNSSGRPPIAASGTNSIIVLDNVLVEFENNFYFNTGSLFFKNNVLFSGDFQFFYPSEQKSFIQAQSTLGFDRGSTFYYIPQNLETTPLIMQDDSSKLLFDGATFRTTTTGMGLTTGKLFLKNNVSLEPGAKILDPLSPLTTRDYGTEIKSVAWSPSGNYLAIGGTGATSSVDFPNTNEVRIYRLDLSTTDVLYPVTSIAYGNIVNTVAWSADGKYLAIAGKNPGAVGGFSNNDEIRIYYFDSINETFSPIISADYGTTQNVNSLEWHPSAYYLAVGGEEPDLGAGGFNNQDNVRIYYFNKYDSSLEPFASVQYDELTVTSTVFSMKWRFTGDYLAVGGYRYSNNSNLKVFAFDKLNPDITQRLTLYQQSGYFSDPNTTGIMGLDWENHGRFIAVGLGGYFITVPIYIYKFDTTSPTPLTQIISLNTYAPTMGAHCIKWNNDGTQLMFASESRGGLLFDSAYIWTITFNYDEISETASLYGAALNQYSNLLGSKLNAISYNPTLNSIAFGGTKPTFFNKKPNSNELQLYNLVPNSIKLANTSLPDGGSTVSWNKNGNYAIVGKYVGSLSLCYFDEYTENIQNLSDYGYGGGWGVFTSAWNPMSDIVAVGGDSPGAVPEFNNNDQLRIYELQQDTLISVTSQSVGPQLTGKIFRVAWHPSGKYIAVGSSGATSGYGLFANTNNVRIYAFNGTTLSAVTSYDFGSICQSLAWSPDGNYLIACGRANGPSYYDVSVLKFLNYSSLIFVTGDTYGSNLAPDRTALTVSWGIENLIAVSGIGAGTKLYKFTGTALNTFATFDYVTNFIWPGSFYFSDDGLRWTCDGRYLILQDSHFGLITIDRQTNEVLLDQPGNNILGLAFRGDGRYFLGVNYRDLTNIYSLNVGSNPYGSQLTGLNLGSRMETKVLGGAQVSLSGNLNYNSQN